MLERTGGLTVAMKKICLSGLAWCFSLCYYFNQILGLIKSVIGKLGHRCHVLTLLETVQVRFYHERSRMKLIKRVIQLHYKVFENYFIGTFTPENDSDGIQEE